MNGINSSFVDHFQQFVAKLGQRGWNVKYGRMQVRVVLKLFVGFKENCKKIYKFLNKNILFVIKYWRDSLPIPWLKSFTKYFTKTNAFKILIIIKNVNVSIFLWEIITNAKNYRQVAFIEHFSGKPVAWLRVGFQKCFKMFRPPQ